MQSKWEERYQPPTRLNWRGRKDGEGATRLHERTQVVDLRESRELQPGYAIVGFACDEGVRRNHGRVGAAGGPDEIKQALANIPLHGELLPHFSDLGNITCWDRDLESSQEALASIVSLAASQNVTLIVLGGGHEVAWGSYLGLSHAKKDDLAIVNIDAHFDLRPLLPGQKGSSGTPFLQISQHAHTFDYTVVGIQKTGNTPALFKQADALGVHYSFADDIHQSGISTALQQVEAALARRKHVQMSICLDAFAAAYAPGVSAPQAMGLCPWQTLPILEAVRASGKLTLMEVAELNPHYDRDGQTASLAAALISRLI